MRFSHVFLISALVTTGVYGSSYAEPKPNDADVVLKVRGMVCSFCVQGVEKKLLGVDGVRKVVVKLKQKSVYLWLIPGRSVKDADLTTAIQAAGYNLDSINRRAIQKQNPKPKLKPTVNEQPKSPAVKE